MHDRQSEIQNRVARMLAERIGPAVHVPVADLDVSAWHVDGGSGEPVDPAVALGLDGNTPPRYEEFAVGGCWGPPWGTSWFHLTGNLPDSVEPAGAEMVINLGWEHGGAGFQAEGLAYRPDGTVIKGLNPLNEWLPVEDRVIDVYVEAAANPILQSHRPTEFGDKHTAGTDPLYRLLRADVNVFHRQVWELVQDLEVLHQLALSLPDGDPRTSQIWLALDGALDLIDLDAIPDTATAAREELRPVLSQPARASAHQLTATGHAHIDSAWLWPTRETVRKVARTTANQVNLLHSHPDLVYAMSSAQQYEWLRDERPEVFAGVAEAVRAGRFVPVGGMWVESDTNMVGSEAMARQFLYGQQFFAAEFGMVCEEVWLPDSFGYSAALPQIVTLAGATSFLTQKISWNQVNKFPHHTFRWEGIDGTRVFTHFPPVDSYNAELTGNELAHAVTNFRDKGSSSHSLVPFGHGDGGGGPTREMIARARRTADLDGSPQVRMRSPQEFFADARAEYTNPPVWKGELYLEVHRGTYTSQAKTKQGNRHSEHLLREAEQWSAMAAIHAGLTYPYDDLARIWKLVLLQQFHDILPGSSIAWVHREARDNYQTVMSELATIIDTAQQALVTTFPATSPHPEPVEGHTQRPEPVEGPNTTPRPEPTPHPEPVEGLSQHPEPTTPRPEPVEGPNTTPRPEPNSHPEPVEGLSQHPEPVEGLSQRPEPTTPRPEPVEGPNTTPRPEPNSHPEPVEGHTPETLFNGSPLPQHGLTGLSAAPADQMPTGPAVQLAHTADGGFTIGNDKIAVTIDPHGEITSAVELATGRETIPPGESANRAQLHTDFPNAWDAWDIDEFYRHTVTDLTAAENLTAEQTSDGSVQVRLRRRFGNSALEQTLRIGPGDAGVEITTTIDWREQEKLLKLAFPVDVHADEAAYETQFGHLRRPTHENTSWDAARFEVCAHRWVHIGEAGFGAGLANDSTYGHNVSRHERPGGGSYSVLRQTLLRGPRYPDPRTDQDRHVVVSRFEIGANIGATVSAGYATNLPPRPQAGRANVPPIVTVDNDAVTVEAIKLAEDQSGDVIVRLYESRGGRAAATLTPGYRFDEVSDVDLLERPLSAIADAPATLTHTDEATATVDLHPFQISSLRFHNVRG